MKKKSSAKKPKGGKSKKKNKSRPHQYGTDKAQSKMIAAGAFTVDANGHRVGMMREDRTYL